MQRFHTDRVCGAIRTVRNALVKTALWTVLVVLAMPCDAPALGQTAYEHELKAVVIQKIVRFVTWPAADATDTLVVGVLGPDPFGDALDRAFSELERHGRPVEILRFGSVEELTRCDVLFVSASLEPRICEVLKHKALDATLTVADYANATNDGVAITLTMLDGRVSIAINNAAAHKAGLTVSSKLLRLAREVSARDGCR